VGQRIDRVDALLREEIGALLAREVQDPGVGFVTITSVEASPDLRHARVWASVIGGPDQRRAALQALERAMPFVRRELGTRLHLKRIPALHVQLDESMARGTRLLRLLDELERGEEPMDLAPGEPLPTPVARLHREGDAAEVDEPGVTPGDEPVSGDVPASPGRRPRPARRPTSRRGPEARGPRPGPRPGKRSR